MKGALGLIAIAVVVYIFWRTWVSDRRYNSRNKRNPKNPAE